MNTTTTTTTTTAAVSEYRAIRRLAANPYVLVRAYTFGLTAEKRTPSHSIHLPSLDKVRSHRLLTMSSELSSTETYSLASLSLACVGILANTLQGEGEPLIASIAFSGLAFALSYALIRWLGNAFMKLGFKGRDLCKLKQNEM